jgi:hypothetical protein
MGEKVLQQLQPVAPADMLRVQGHIEVAAAFVGRHQFIPDFGYQPGVRIAVNFTLDFA